MTNNRKRERLYFDEPINFIENIPTKYDLHWHHYNEIIICPSQCVIGAPPTVCIDQTIYQLQPGDVLLIWSSEMHSVESNPDNALLGIQFAPSLLSDLPEFASFSHLFRSYHLLRQNDEQMVEIAEYIQYKFQQIAEIRSEKGSFYGVEMLINLYELFMHFGNHLQKILLPKDISNLQGNTKTMDKINAACRYISENCDKDLTLDSVAESIGFSSCYFSRIFKQTIQRNFVEYLTLQRLKRAQSLLADSDNPITSIAMESGFKSISTFNRVFQKYKGCSPSEFKKHYQQHE